MVGVRSLLDEYQRLSRGKSRFGMVYVCFTDDSVLNMDDESVVIS